MSFDLADYLCPLTPGSRYLLIGVDGTSSYEICSTIQDSKGYRRFLKNQHYETLWFDDLYIYRGLDTSGLPNEVYAQWTGERYGAAWAKRWMNEGDVFKRRPDIRKYDANGREISRADGGVTYLRLIQHHDTLKLPTSPIPLEDILEFNWTSDPDGKHIIETYWYQKGRGLVGFDYFGDPPFHSRFAGLTSEINGFAPLPNFQEPAPPPVEKTVIVLPPDPPPTNPIGDGIRAAVNAPNGVYLRQTPGGKSIRALTYAEEVTVWEQPAIPSGKYIFIPVRTFQNEDGFAAQKVEINGQWSDTFIPAKLPTLFQLKAPFRKFRITGRFNDPRDYRQLAPNKKQLHEGLDCVDAHAESVHTDPMIHAGAPGKVTKVGYDPKGYGNYVVIDFQNGFVGWYGHLNRVYVSEGQVLPDWEIIGLMGWSGNVYPIGEAGAHCHLTVQHLGQGLSGYVVSDVVDPELYLVPA